jgi:hypothetical protein
MSILWICLLLLQHQPCHRQQRLTEKNNHAYQFCLISIKHPIGGLL